MTRSSNPSPMSPSTPSGVDGATTPKPAGTKAGMSVNPTERIGIMLDIKVLGAEDVLVTERRASFIHSLKPENGFSLSQVLGNCITYLGPNKITWYGVIVDDYMFDQIGDVTNTIWDGGAKDLAILRFPCGFGWAEHDEALAFWLQVLPVNASRILFTSTEMNYVYLQLASGHIMNLTLQCDGEFVNDQAVISSLFVQIIESQQVAR